MILADTHEFQRRLDHAQWCVTVAVQHPVRERAVVRANTHGHAKLPTPAHEGRKARGNPLQLRGVLPVGVLADDEALAIGEVARIDADLFDVLRRFEGCCRTEVDVGDERDANTALVQLGADSPQRTRVRDHGDGDADDFATGCD